jgi:hypothetical protein
MIRRLNKLLPKASPAAKFAPSGPPTKDTALTPVPSSGKEVAVAKSTTPTKERPNPVLNAITSAFFVNCVAANRIIAAEQAN